MLRPARGRISSIQAAFPFSRPRAAARERLSAEMDFEGAALMHQRLRRIEEVLALRDEMARDVERLNAIAIVPSALPEAVELGWLRHGCWQGFTRLEFTAGEGRSVSLDARLRETAATHSRAPRRYHRADGDNSLSSPAGSTQRGAMAKCCWWTIGRRSPTASSLMPYRG